jgi:acyl-CoA dehydrogenase
VTQTAFELTDEQLASREWICQVARERLLPIAQRGAEGAVNRELVKELGSLGLLQRLFPVQDHPPASDGTASGGIGSGRPQAAALELCLLREALASVSTEAETALALQGLGTYPIVQAGTREQVDRWVPLVAAGEAVAAYALSETSAAGGA